MNNDNYVDPAAAYIPDPSETSQYISQGVKEMGR